MNSLLVGVSVFVVVMVSGALALGYPYDEEFSSWRLARQSRRSHQCAGSGSKCFSSTECCAHFVCAAFDDYFGMKPEVPGFCVREKDLVPCYSDSECEGRTRCVKMGRNGDSYCLPTEQPAVERVLPQMSYQRGRGGKGYGMSCSATSDCKMTDKAGNELCCQLVNRGRQGKKNICDRVTELSNCM